MKKLYNKQFREAMSIKYKCWLAMIRWLVNIEDLELYIKNLHDEIDKVNQILKSKKGVTDSAAALFNNQ